MSYKEKQPRGLRNNNPLNIRITATAWQGKITPNTDGEFEQFKTLELGIRAALVNIRTLIRRDHCDRLPLLIGKWAPSSDGNNVGAYIKAVAAKANINEHERLMYANKNQMCRLAWAMAFVECGQEISFGRVENAWALI